MEQDAAEPAAPYDFNGRGILNQYDLMKYYNEPTSDEDLILDNNDTNDNYGLFISNNDKQYITILLTTLLFSFNEQPSPAEKTYYNTFHPALPLFLMMESFKNQLDDSIGYDSISDNNQPLDFELYVKFYTVMDTFNTKLESEVDKPAKIALGYSLRNLLFLEQPISDANKDFLFLCSLLRNNICGEIDMNVDAYDETLSGIITSTEEADMSPADLIAATAALIKQINTKMKTDITSEMDGVITSTMMGGKRRKTQKGKKTLKGKKGKKGKNAKKTQKGKKGKKAKKTQKGRKKTTRKNKKVKKTTRRK